MAEKALEIVLSARDEASKTVEKVDKTFKSFLAGVKKGLGEESTLGLLGKSFAGAGAVSGLTNIATQAQRVAETIGSLKKDIQGGIDLPEIFTKATAPLPIIGQFAEAGAAIRELLTDEKASLDFIKQDSAAQLHIMELRVKQQTTINEQTKELGRIAKQIHDEGYLNTLSPTDRGAAAAGAAGENAQQSLDDLAKGQSKARREEARVIYDEQSKRIADLKKQSEELGGIAGSGQKFGDFLNPADRGQKGEARLKQKAEVDAQIKDAERLQLAALKRAESADAQSEGRIGQLKKERAEVDAANVSRAELDADRIREQAREQHEETLTRIKREGETERLRTVGANVAAEISQRQQATDELIAARRKQIEEEVKQGTTYGDVGDQRLNEFKGAVREKLQNDIRQTIGKDFFGRIIPTLFGDAKDAGENLLTRAETQLRRSFGLTGIPKPEEKIATHADASAQPQSRFLTGSSIAGLYGGASQVPDPPSGKSAAETLKRVDTTLTAILAFARTAFPTLDVNVGDDPTAVL